MYGDVAVSPSLSHCSQGFFFANVNRNFFFATLEWEPSIELRSVVPRTNTCIHWSYLAVKKKNKIICSSIITLFITFNLWDI